MKRCIPLILALTLLLPAMCAHATPEVDDLSAWTGTDAYYLYYLINSARSAASQPLLARDEGLDRIARAYAGWIFYNRQPAGFRTLPNGEKVVTLAHRLDIPVMGFSYSVFSGRPEDIVNTREFQSKAVNGDFTRIGMICLAERRVDGQLANSYLTVIVYDRMPTLTPAQRYLRDTPDADILAHFVKSVDIGTGANFAFSTPAEITSDDLYRFAVIYGDFDGGMAWYNREDQKFYIPLADITDCLDAYLTGYVFVPEEVMYVVYDQENERFITEATGFGGMQSDFILTYTSAIGYDTVRVRMENWFDGEHVSDIVIAAKIVDGRALFESCLFIRGDGQ